MEKRQRQRYRGWVSMARQACAEGQPPELAVVVAESGFQVLYS